MTRLPNRIRMAAAMAAMILGGATFAQADVAGDWNQRGNGAMTQPPAQPIGDFGGQQGAGGQGSRSRTSASDFPDDSVHDWVVANARWAYSRAAFRRAERELDNVIRNTQMSFDQSTDYQHALAEEKRAHDAYTAERAKALQSVVSDPKYLAALQLRDQTGDQISKFKSEYKDQLPAGVTLTLASQKLRYASDAHQLEVAALQNAESVKTAQAKLVDANAKVLSLRQGFDNSLRNNPQILEARRNLEDSRLAVAGSEAYLNAARDAAAVATDYTYFRHRWDGLASPVVGGVGPYGGFGFGPYGGVGY